MAKRIVVTGGGGFIGSNQVHSLVSQGHEVVVFDNLSRKGAEKNIAWLKAELSSSFEFIKGDIRNPSELNKVIRNVDAVYHLAGQVAVTSSVINPREDFEINALGTFNVLEAARQLSSPPLIVYASTNKVYGGLQSLHIKEESTRYVCIDLPNGVPETYPLDFHSPYGCSKGSADQYVRDYGRIYDIPTVVLRQSCIYGQRQFGIEDQGWVAWFLICGVLKRAFSIYGDGKQVRDILHVNDLIRFFDLLLADPGRGAGKIYNVGGGIDNSISVWCELGPILKKLFGQELETDLCDWRPGDQRFFVADCSLAQRELGWQPQVSIEEGIRNLFEWVSANKDLFS